MSFGGVKALSDVDLEVEVGEIRAVIGPNGAGKSSLINIISGLYHADRGRIAIGGQSFSRVPASRLARLGVARTFQNLALFGGLSVRNNIACGRVHTRRASFVEHIAGLPRARSEDAGIAEKTDQIVAFLHLESVADRLVATLPYGLQKRVELARALVAEPKLLLLDEPTNHLDAETTQWLEKHLRDYPGSVLIITHDRYFLDNVTGWILELDRGRGIPYEGNYTKYLDAKAKRLIQEGREDDSRQKAIWREREWIQSSPKARQTKSKARIKAYEELVEQSQNRKPTDTQIVIPASERLGNVVIEVEGLNKGFGDE
ncbi:MAG: ATP-binding cassette domain-containing protein, partial [Mesorhizobium sp.]